MWQPRGYTWYSLLQPLVYSVSPMRRSTRLREHRGRMQGWRSLFHPSSSLLQSQCNLTCTTVCWESWPASLCTRSCVYQSVLGP